MKTILSFTILCLIFISCKKEKTITNPPKNEPEVDYREKYIGEYNCAGFYEVYIKGSQYTFKIDTFDINYNIAKSGDSSIIIEGRTLKMEKDGYFGPRFYNTKFENPNHGGFLGDTLLYYTKDLYFYDSLNRIAFKRLYIDGTKNK